MARRAVNLHGCALPHFAPLLRPLRHALPLCPLFFLLRGYPRERIWYESGACAFCAIVALCAFFYVPEWHDPSVFNL